jgi:NhaA family Na+:H+ antiporter
MPLFAFANAGVAIAGVGALADRVALGVVAGLLIGKPAGVMLFSWIAVKLGWAELPAGTSWRAIFGVAWLAGIGFTMSLFVGGLALGEAALYDAAKVGILAGSAVAGLVGWRILSRIPQPN